MLQTIWKRLGTQKAYRNIMPNICIRLNIPIFPSGPYPQIRYNNPRLIPPATFDGKGGRGAAIRIKTLHLLMRDEETIEVMCLRTARLNSAGPARPLAMDIATPPHIVFTYAVQWNWRLCRSCSSLIICDDTKMFHLNCMDPLHIVFQIFHL